MREGFFTPGEYEAARFFVAGLTQRSSNQSFSPKSIGFKFPFDVPIGVSDTDVEVTSRDFISAAFKIMLGQLRNLEHSSGHPIAQLVADLGIAVASEDPGARKSQ